MFASRAGATSQGLAAVPPQGPTAPQRSSTILPQSSASSQGPSAAPPRAPHRPRAARLRTTALLVLALIALALAAVFLVGLAVPNAALAANQKPSVTSLSPASGTTAGGTTVTVSGRAFTSFGRSLVTRVVFGAKVAHYRVGAHSTVICTAPAGTGTVNVFVTTKGGTTAKVSADRYAYKAPIVAPAITAFAFAGRDTTISGVIDQSAHTIAATVPFGTSLTALVATFTTTGSAVKVGGVAQVSGVTANDFSAPVVYTVSAAGAPAQSYTVTVTVAPSSAKAITSFGFDGLDPAVTGTIDQSAHTIDLTVPYGTSLDGLVATFTTTGASVYVTGETQSSGHTVQGFSDPVVYKVVAADGSNQDYTVTVTVAADPAKAITAFSFGGLDPTVTGAIDETAHTIALTVPYGTDPSELIASFTTTGASVAIGDVAQTSGATANDFSDPVTYTVTAADGTTQDYTVTVTVAASLVVGQSYGGGVVAWLADPGDPAAEQSGLIAATDDLVAPWAPDGDETTSVPGTGTALGSGSANTTLIMLQYGPGEYAASVARAYNGGGFSDWYLPSKDEVAQLYANEDQIGGFDGDDYWSSSEYTAGNAWAEYFYLGVPFSGAKHFEERLRPVRSFPADPAKAIGSFTFPASTATTIDQSAHTIAVTMPYGTDLSDLTASFTTTGAVVAVGNTPQASGTTSDDFSDPVTYTVTAADASTQDYTVTVTVAPAPPQIEAVDPPCGPMTAATGVTITGSGFTGATAVRFGAAAATNVVVVNDTQITCTAPSSAQSHTVDVTVTTPAGTSALTGGDTYSYLPVVLGLSSYVGDLDGGATITITGEGFTGVTAVAFGVNDPATDVVVVNDTHITCTVPAWIPQISQHASVTVTGPAGTSNGAFDGVSYYYYEMD